MTKRDGGLGTIIIALALTLQLLMSVMRWRIATQCDQYGYPDWAWTHGKELCIRVQDGAYVAEPLVNVRARLEGK